MLRKLSLFLLLGIILSIFSACSESSEPTPVFVTTIEGTYDVTFFGTVTNLFGGFIVISDNCTKAATYKVTPDGAECDNLTKSTGEIVVSNTDGKIKIISKIQMEGGNLIDMSPTDKFQYTEYTPIVPAFDRASGKGEGVVGYNLDPAKGELSETPVTYPDSPFDFSLLANELTINMTLKNKITPIGVVNAKTTVKAKKRNNSTTVPTKARFWNFSK